MRLVIRALVYGSLPSVAFAWLLRIDFPTASWDPHHPFFAPPEPNYLLEALLALALGAGLLTVVIAAALLFGVSSTPTSESARLWPTTGSKR